MLPPAEGIAAVRRELAAATNTEVVIAGALGAMLKERAEPDLMLTVAGVLHGAAISFTVADGLAVELALDPQMQPFLHDHQINGVPVLPGVMALELMAEAARLPFANRFVTEFSAVDFHAPFKFYRGEPRRLKVIAQFTTHDGAVMAACALIGERMLHGKAEPEVTVHFSARVTLSEQPLTAAPARAVLAAPSATITAHDIYRIYFHGPSYQVLARAWRANGSVVGELARELPPDRAVDTEPLLIAPRLIELAFQTAGLAEIAAAERMGLPYHIDRLELHASGNGEPTGASAAVLVPASANGFDIEVTDATGHVLMVLHGYRTASLPDPVEAAVFKPLSP
jgi:hypothetical protein